MDREIECTNVIGRPCVTGPLRAEVEELEECAAAMRRQWPAAVERAARRLNGPIDYDRLRREFGIPSR